MPIERVSFPEGIPVNMNDDLFDINRIVAQALLDQHGQVIPLPRGKYDITPLPWRFDKDVPFLVVAHVTGRETAHLKEIRKDDCKRAGRRRVKTIGSVLVDKKHPLELVCDFGEEQEGRLYEAIYLK